jgi:hypothetical protein
VPSSKDLTQKTVSDNTDHQPVALHRVSIKTKLNIVMFLVAIDGVWIGNRIYWTFTIVTTNNHSSLTELHTPKFTATTAHIKYSQSSLAVAW